MEKDYGHIEEWINTTDDFLIVIDTEGKIIRMNQAWIDFCKKNRMRDSIYTLGTNYLEQLENQGKLTELKIIISILQNKVSEHSLKYPLLLENGETQWLQVKAKNVQSDTGHLQGAIIFHKPIALPIIQPISAEIVLESMTEGFLLLDNNLQVIYMNEIAEGLLDYKRGMAVGHSLITLFPESADTIFPEYYKRALTEQTVMEFIDYYKPLDKWFQVKACPLDKGGLSVYFQDVSERKRTEEQLTEFALYDYLTGLPNRRMILNKIEALVDKRVKFSIFHLTVDNLNFINAIHSHNVGDSIIKKLSEELKKFTSETCHISRSNNNEFLIVWEATHGEKLEHVVQRFESIFLQPVLIKNTQKVFMSSSIGIACYPFDASTVGEVLSHAEIAMLEAKNIYGVSHTFFRPQMITQRNRRTLIEESLNDNLSASGFYYTLQPQINALTEKVVGVEVLARWLHPDLGEISPLEFIQVAEETGQIVHLTSSLLKQVFTQMKTWETKFNCQLRTAINMTPSLLSSPIFFDHFLDLVERYRIPPQLLEIEITEQAELTYSPKTLENLLLCKSKGITISIDDFGTGFSMISYLTHFPIDKIKIDRSFVQKIGQDRKSEAVLTSLIYLAKSIECDVVAEGVERRIEVDFLQENGCDIFQGYLYDKPLKPEIFEAKYLKNSNYSTVLKEVINSSYS